MTPRQAGSYFRQLGKDLERTVRKAVNRATREGKQIARQDSLGRWNRKRRRKAGYSYSRHRPNPPPQDLGIINKETGVFLGAWRVEAASLYAGGEIAAFVINDSDRAEELINPRGKPWLARPIDMRVRSRVEPVAQFEIETAVWRFLKEA